MSEALLVKYENVRTSSVYGTYPHADVARRTPGTRITGYLFAAGPAPRGDGARGSAVFDPATEPELRAD